MTRNIYRAIVEEGYIEFLTEEEALKVSDNIEILERDIPTEEEIQAEKEVKEKEFKATEYQRLRKAEYPDIGDQLDAIMKWAFTETEIGLPEELKSLAGQCMSVKSKYPKPEES